MSNFRNVENNGVWELGGTYTFEAFHQITDDFAKLLIEDNGIDSPAGVSESYIFSNDYNLTELFNEQGSEWKWKDDCIKGASGVGLEGRGVVELTGGNITVGLWRRYTVRVNSDMSNGFYKLLHIHYTLTAGIAQPDDVLLDVEEYEITLGTPTPESLGLSIEWPEDRPSTYDPDKKWAWDGTQYAWATGGGGRYRNQLIAVGFDSNGKGTVYFGDI